MKFAFFNPLVMAVTELPLNLLLEVKDLVGRAHRHKNLNDAGNQQISVRGGQQIQIYPNDFDMSISALKDFIEKQCQEYLNTVRKQSGKTDLDNVRPVLVSAWTIQQTSGHYQTLHCHEAHISGNIYVEVPELDVNSDGTDSNIEFQFPVIRNPLNFIFVDHWRFPPQEGKMIVFPSYIPHTVYPWHGQGTRTVLAWDVKLVQKEK
jgi:hypothetical protein